MSFREFFETQEINQTLWTIYQKIRSKFDPWLAEYQHGNMQSVRDIMSSEEEFHYYLNEYTVDHLDFEIREDGLIVPERITAENQPIIGNLAIVVYHHTSDSIDNVIQMRGLQSSNEPGVDQVNPYLNTSSGVYVTTQYSGSVVDGYHQAAVDHHGGNDRTWEIITTIDQLSNDADDADLDWSHGRQFVLNYVDPSYITQV